MAKSIQSFEIWGYVVERNARGFKNVSFQPNGKHCNIFHPDSADPMIPINTFTVTEDDKNLLKIPRTFNHHRDYDPRPKGQKLSLRDQVVSYWSTVENRDLKDLNQIKYLDVIEDNLQCQIEEVYHLMGADEYDELMVRSNDPIFKTLVAKTPFLAGVQKMLDEYADKFPGKKIHSCQFHTVGGFASFDFTINLT